jgi:hypothetical protein
VSREVIGDAPAGLQVAPAPTPVLVPQAAPQRPARAAGRRRHLPALAAATAIVVLATGWTAYRVTNPPGDPARGVVAAVTGATSAGVNSAQPTRRALLAITIANPGTDTVTVDGYAYTTRSSAAVGLDEPRAHVSPGERVELTVDVSLDCARAAPLLLPDLVIEESDGGRREVPAVGAVATLMGICEAGPPAGQPLTVTGTRREGNALVVGIAVPSNRRTTVRAVRATGVVLDAGELPLRVDRLGQELRLTPPATCPKAWVEDGVPQYLDVEIDTEGPSISALRVGKPLAAWVLDVVCRDAA